MSELRRDSERGVGTGVVFILVVLAVIVAGFLWKLSSRQAPSINLLNPPKGLGQKTELIVDVKDPKHNIKSVALEVVQAGQVIHQSNIVISAKPHPWWKFWARE